jgi:hypothetical protein
MYTDEIKRMRKALTRATDTPNKELAEKMGITPTRFSALIGQGDMKLSSFLKLLEVSGFQMEISPTENGEVAKLLTKNKCNECAYKQIAEQVNSANVHLDENKKLVIEV